jgi:hypothetical protein
VEGCYGSGDTPQDVARTAKNKRFSANEVFWRVFVSMYIWPVAGASGHQCFITLNVPILKAKLTRVDGQDRDVDGTSRSSWTR